MGVLYTHSSKMASPSKLLHKTKKKSKKKIQKFQKNGGGKGKPTTGGKLLVAR
jgi:hypothetical protein